MIPTQSRDSERRRFWDSIGILMRGGDIEGLRRVVAYGWALVDGDHERARDIEVDTVSRWFVTMALKDD